MVYRLREALLGLRDALYVLREAPALLREELLVLRDRLVRVRKRFYPLRDQLVPLRWFILLTSDLNVGEGKIPFTIFHACQGRTRIGVYILALS